MKLVKRSVSVLLLLVAIYLLAFGQGAAVPAPPGFVVVEYWEKWTAAEAQAMSNIVDDFNNTVGKDKHIFVHFVSTAGIEQKTLVAAAAGVPPDVAGLFDMDMVQFASLGALQPLDQMAAEHGINADTYKPVYWDAGRYKGQQYGLVSTPAAVALIYNKRIFHDSAAKLIAAGLDPNRPPKTLDELDAYAKALDQFSADGRMTRAGFLPNIPGWFLNLKYMWFGGEIWDPVHEKFMLTSPAVVRSLAWLKGYSTRLGSNAINDFKSGVGNFDSPQNEFMTGSVVMEEQGPWMANFIALRKPQMDGLKPGEVDDPSQPLDIRRAKMDWAFAAVPSAVPGLNNVTYAPSDLFTIPRGAKHPREAFEYIAFASSRPEMEKLCYAHSKQSPLRTTSVGFLNHHTNPYIDVFEMLSASPNARDLPKVPIWAETQDELTNVAQRVATLQAEPEVALREAQDRLQKHYDQYAARLRLRQAAEN